MKKKLSIILCSIILAGTSSEALAAEKPQQATKYTINANKETIEDLNFKNKQDFKDAQRGFIATWPTDQIKDANGNVVWDFSKWDFLGEPGVTKAPPTVNPSLWRQSQLASIHGLFKVEKGVYQVRGFDLANITFLRGKKGWVVVDTCTSAEVAKAAYKLLKENVADLPITGVVLTHSHIDHFGGVAGLISQKDIDSGKVELVVPEGFYKHSISENLNAGNTMSRRSSYMYGNILPKNPKGSVGSGLGQTVSTGDYTILEPSTIISKTGTVKKIDGLEFDFLMAQGTEAPSEMMFYIPKYKTLCSAEVVTHTLHNISTLRGAQSREADKWSKAIDNAYQMWGDKAKVMFSPHHWPTWGQKNINEMLVKQRDTYRFINDQTLRMANEGLNPDQIAENMKLPKELGGEFYNRGYYGSVSHNTKATYDRYFGAWWDGTPARLNPLTPVQSAKKTIKYMGGADKVLKMAQESYDKGEYRWVAEITNKVVYADPKNQEARNLEADALEQLGYQAESGPWRNYYLTGAQELRNGILKAATPNTASKSISEALPMLDFFDFLAIKIIPARAEGMDITINVKLTDLNENYNMHLANSTLNSHKGLAKHSDTTVTMKKSDFNKVITGESTLSQEIKKGNIKVTSQKVLDKFLGVLDKPKFWFNVITPNQPTMK